MPLNENEKERERDAIGLALELNEPETMIEGLKRLCAKKAVDAHIGDNERNRWRNAADALASVSKEIELANAPQARSKTDESAPDTPSAA